MKIRTGFVSNSSSSSFIIGLAAINKTETIPDELTNYITIVPRTHFAGKPSITSFDDTYISIDCPLDKNVAIIDVICGDNYEYWEDENEYYNYNITLDHPSFDHIPVDSLINFINNHNGVFSYGAGRDG